MSVNPATPESAAEERPSHLAQPCGEPAFPGTHVHFYSYFKDLTGCAETVLELPAGATVAVVVRELETRFPRLIPMRRSTLIAVGVDYQGQDYVLQQGDEVSLFPPVQGG